MTEWIAVSVVLHRVITIRTMIESVIVLPTNDQAILARVVGAKRLFVAGSFVTAKHEPEDVDAVVLLPDDFAEQVDRGRFDALELAEMLTTRQPEEIFAAEDERDWYDWLSFFTKTREPDGTTCGIVEVKL